MRCHVTIATAPNCAGRKASHTLQNCYIPGGNRPGGNGSIKRLHNGALCSIFPVYVSKLIQPTKNPMPVIYQYHFRHISLQLPTIFRTWILEIGHYQLSSGIIGNILNQSSRRTKELQGKIYIKYTLFTP